MSQRAKREYLETMRERYRAATGRRERGRLLSEAQAITKLSRKHLIRILGGSDVFGPPAPRGRTRKFPLALGAKLFETWNRMGRPCSKRFKAGLQGWLPSFTRHGIISNDEGALLLQMSAATMDRILRKYRKERGLSATRRPSSQWYKNVIPIQPKDWNVTEPGHFQGDTVAHCGESLKGSFVNTLTLTDILSSWTELRAVWEKRAFRIVEALRDIYKTLPFWPKSTKFDSGSEFMNGDVVSYIRSNLPEQNKPKLQLTRSRPYRKNDNCYVEQKNLTHVRELIGYARIDVRECVDILNDIYRNAWCPLVNNFMPAMKLIRKERRGSRIVKIYDKPRTPFERLMESSALTEEQKQRLVEARSALDPIDLSERVESGVNKLHETLRRLSTPVANAA